MINKEEVERIIKNECEGPNLDYKKDLVVEKEGDKAEFIKDVVSLANSAKIAHIIIGVEDTTRKLVGLKTTHSSAQLNDILKNRCDPPISLEYSEMNIYGHIIGIIEIKVENPPYIISVNDKFGGECTYGEQCFIHRGIVYIRNNDKNDEASREHIEKMYENKVKYVTVQADLQLSHSSSITSHDEYKEVIVDFKLSNTGDILAGSPFMYISFENIEQITNCNQFWLDITHLNPKPTVQYYSGQPIAGNVKIGGITLRVKKDIKQISALVELYSTNMRRKIIEYIIKLDS